MVAITKAPDANRTVEPLGDTFMTEQELCDELRISKSTIKRWQDEVDFPLGRKIGPRAVRYSAAEIRKWLDGVFASIENIPDDIAEQIENQDAMAAELSDRQNEREISRDKK